MRRFDARTGDEAPPLRVEHLQECRRQLEPRRARAEIERRRHRQCGQGADAGHSPQPDRRADGQHRDRREADRQPRRSTPGRRAGAGQRLRRDVGPARGARACGGQRLLEDASRGEARRGIGGDGALDGGDERVGQIGSAIAQPRAPPGAVRRFDLGARRAFDRVFLRHQVIEQHAEAVDVGGRRRRPAAQALGAEIQRRAGERVVAGRDVCIDRPAPKSMRTTRPPSSRITLCALTSPWTSPLAWTAASAPHSARPMTMPRRRCARRAPRPRRPASGRARTPSTGRRGRRARRRRARRRCSDA